MSRQDNFLDLRQSVPSAQRLAAKIVHETSTLPQQKSIFGRLQGFMAPKPVLALGLAAFAALVIALSMQTGPTEMPFEELQEFQEIEMLTMLVNELE